MSTMFQAERKQAFGHLNEVNEQEQIWEGYRREVLTASPNLV